MREYLCARILICKNIILRQYFMSYGQLKYFKILVIQRVTFGYNSSVKLKKFDIQGKLSKGNLDIN